MDKELLKKLYELTEESKKIDDFPVGAIIYDESGIISCGFNKRNTSNKTTDHAEIIAIEEANKILNSWNLENKCMLVSLEPCDMCKTVIRESRLKRVTYLIPRYQYKKQYKCTISEEADISEVEKEKFITDISTFFKNKR